ncbi:MAG: glycosyltransferase family 2 protein [bacterium]|nr:glycosyltransferase family 2 protein [bacterium]
MKKPHLSVVIPAYNEALRIQTTLESVDAYLKQQLYSYEVIIVNDGSKDTTVSVVEAFIKTTTNFKLIDNQTNHGKGWVVRQGMLEAQGKFRLFMDADNSTTIDHVEKFFEEFENKYDIVISSRRIVGAQMPIRQSIIRELLGSIFRKIVQTIVPLGVVDSQNGFKLFTAEAAEHIFARQVIVSWAFDVEILALARLFGYKIKEEPVCYIDDARSHMTTKGMIKMLREVIQVKINLFAARY